MQILDHAAPIGCFFRPTPESVPQARKWLRSRLRTEGPDLTVAGERFSRGDLEVVVSELATNAVRASAASGRDGAAWSYRLMLARPTWGLYIDVTDPSPQLPVIRQAFDVTEVTDLQECGRGLPMLREFGFSWHALQCYQWGSKTVRYVLRADQQS